MLIRNSAIAFIDSILRITFFGKFGPETSNINNSFLNSVPKIHFSGKFLSRNFKVLCFRQNPLQ